MEENEKQINAAIKALEKYGKGKARTASTIAPVEVIPTGIHDFDKNVLGVGG